MKQTNNKASERIIFDQFKADKDYKRNEVTIRKSYITSLQIAKYSVQQSQYDNQLISAGFKLIVDFQGTTPQGKGIFFICGKNQQDNYKQLMSHIVAKLEPFLDKGFIIYYFNTGLYTHINLSKFFQYYRGLPVEYFVKLEVFYIIHGNFFIKSWFWFQGGIQISVLQSKVVYLKKLSQLVGNQDFQLKQYQAIPQYVKQEDHSHERLGTSLDSQKSMLEKQRMEVIGLNIGQYELNDKGIPLCLDLLVSQLDSNKNYLTKEGVFRVNASMSNEKQIEEILAHQDYEQLIEIRDPYAIAGVIKKIFDKMPMPLIPTWFYDFAIKQKRGKISIEEFKERIQTIPKVNYYTLVFITGFLTRVALFKEENKMTAHNLAVVFAPSFLRPEVYNLNDYITDASMTVDVFQMMVDKHNEVMIVIQYIARFSKINNTTILCQVDSHQEEADLSRR